MSEFLLEVRTDGLPLDVVAAGVQRLKQELVRELRRRDLPPDQSATSFTGRRMMVLLRGLEGGDDKADKRKAVLIEAVPLALARVDWPASLPAIGDSPPWPRPVRAVLAILDGEPVRIEGLGSASVGTSVGHPILSPEPFAISDSTDYARKLASRGIEIRLPERRRRLHDHLEEALKGIGGGHMIADDELLEELVGSLEIPGAVAGEFDREFLALPRELVVRCLRRRHRAFAVAETVDSVQLRPLFVAAMDRLDDPKGHVRRGQELALRGHLEDLRYQFDEDRKTPLAERQRRRLKESHEADDSGRTGRVSELAGALCRDLGWREEADRSEEAAALLEADLSTRLVRQLPGLRGVVGGLLAREEGYPESVWQGIYDHRLPEPRGKAIPRGRVGKVVALAWRLEELVSCLATSQLSTGASGGMQAMEEIGVGAVRVLLQGDVELDLDLAAARAARLGGAAAGSAGDLVAALRSLFDRCTRVVLAREGYLDDEVEAVLGASGSRMLPGIQARLAVIHRARQEEPFDRVVQAAIRLVSVLGESQEGRVEAELLEEPAERELWQRLCSSREGIDRALAENQAERWLRAMMALTESLERFLAEVLVRDEDEVLRHNRLALLQAVHRVYSRQVRLAELAGGASVD